MRKIIVYTLLGLLIIILGVVIISCSSNPLRKSENQIRESVLGITPIGMNMDDVMAILENKGKWDNLTEYDKWGVLYDERLGRPTHYANYIEEFSEHFDIIGEKSISIHMGHYPVFLAEMYVRAWWAFDENSQLIDVIIEKSASGF